MVPDKKWIEIKADYLAGMSIADIARKYKLDYNSTKHNIYKRKWKEERLESSKKITEKVQNRVVESLVEQQLQVKDRYAKYFKTLSTKLQSKISKSESVSSLAQIARALDYCRKNEFACYGIPDKVELTGKDGSDIKIEISFV